MATQIRDTLVELVRAYAQQGPLQTPSGNSAVAQEILNFRPGLQPINKETVKTEDPRGPSPLNRFIDVLSRPLYSTMNLTKELVENPQATPGEIGSALWQGFSGKEKTLGSDVLEAANVENDFARGALGFGLDVVADPLTYVGLGLASKLGRGVSRGVEALGEVERTSGRAAQDLARQISDEAATGTKTPSPLEAPRTFIGEPSPERLALPSGRAAPSPEAPARTFQVKMPSAGPAPKPDDTPRLIAATPQGSAAIVGTAETIATPIPKPVSVRDMFDDLLKAETEAGSTQRARMVQGELRKLTEQPHSPAQRVNVADILRDLAKQEKSPPVRNMILQQARKVEANVNPAKVQLGQAGRPLPRPPIQASARQRAEADRIADEFLQRNKFDEINHVGQTNLFNRVMN